MAPALKRGKFRRLPLTAATLLLAVALSCAKGPRPLETPRLPPSTLAKMKSLFKSKSARNFSFQEGRVIGPVDSIEVFPGEQKLGLWGIETLTPKEKLHEFEPKRFLLQQFLQDSIVHQVDSNLVTEVRMEKRKFRSFPNAPPKERLYFEARFRRRAVPSPGKR